MNDLFRLFENFGPKTIKVAHPQVSDSLQEQAFELRFADASSAMDEALFDDEPLAAMVTGQEKVDRLSSELSFQPEGIGNADQSFAQSVIAGASDVSAIAPDEEMKSAEKLQHSATKTDDFGDQNLRLALADATKTLYSEKILSPLLLREPTIASSSDEADAASSLGPVFPAGTKTLSGNRVEQIITQETIKGLAALDDGTSLPARTFDSANISMPSAQSAAHFSAMEIAGLSQKAARTGTVIATPLDTLDIETGDQWIGRLGMEVSRLAGEKTTLSFQLKPNNLGKLQVEITSDGAGNIVRLETESETARQLIVGAQGRLEQDIRLGGSKLVRVDVTSQEQSQPQTGDHNADSQARRPAAEQRGYGVSEGSLVEPVTLPAFGSKFGSQFGERYA
ncbi:hypothetical protein GCM10009096_07720 [Parasphingorhabdus litoris]|uniref:Flagellar hook-length control protein-like C-terminal domain-containing protein n=2 Tax=Parasphingorhabdus litoris TaxID=394733 RepID=A0ABN1A757_9SPHN